MRSLLAEYAFGTPWALDAGVFDRAQTILLRHLAGHKGSAEDIEAAIGRPAPSLADQEQRYEARGGVAIIPIGGVIDKHAQNVNAICTDRGTSTEAIQKDIRTALGDETVHTLLFQIESPGGSISGLKETADLVRAASATKRTVAFYDGMACSAALWLGAQCQECYATETALVGSIGVYSSMVDSEKWAEQEGLKVHKLTTGKFKGAGLPGTAITPEQVAEGQARVNEYFAMFVEAIMVGREMSREAVLEIADGRTWIGQRAIDAGLVDGLATFPTLLAELTAGHNRQSQAPGGSRSAPSPGTATPAGATSTAGTAGTNGGDPAIQGTQNMKLSMAVAMALVASYPAHAPLVKERAAKAATDDSITDHSVTVEVLEAEIARLKAEAGTRETAHAAALKVEQDKATAAEAARAALQTKHDALLAIGKGADSSLTGGPGNESLAGLAGEALWKAEFARDAKLQTQYGNDEKAYLAEKKYTTSKSQKGA
jgi:signal peptide peptidase SppA